MTADAPVPHRPDIAAGRLHAAALAENFSDLHPPLNAYEARIEADRCFFCYDAPCQSACPTSIDVPLFIREIAAGNALGAAKTIYDANILGGMCARVCPTETLCEQACVRETSEGKPVQIGLLQRYATDAYMATGEHPYERAAPTGKKIAILGAGPAGLACAHALAKLGHEVTIHERRPKPGGLNEYGVAAYKATDNFAAREAEFVLAIGGVKVEYGVSLGGAVSLDGLRQTHDAVFIGIGLPKTNALGLKADADYANLIEAVDFIEGLRQASNLAHVAVGRRVVVVGGGMTAIDAAVQSKRLGAEHVTLVYRRSVELMKASPYERELAMTHGVTVLPWAKPMALHGEGDALKRVHFERTREEGDALVGTGEMFSLEADVVFSAIGQKGAPSLFHGSHAPAMTGDRIAVDDQLKTSLPNVWAGGDCVVGDLDLTVSAVDDGKRAAASIHAALTAKG